MENRNFINVSPHFLEFLEAHVVTTIFTVGKAADDMIVLIMKIANKVLNQMANTIRRGQMLMISLQNLKIKTPNADGMLSTNRILVPKR